MNEIPENEDVVKFIESLPAGAQCEMTNQQAVEYDYRWLSKLWAEYKSDIADWWIWISDIRDSLGQDLDIGKEICDAMDWLGEAQQHFLKVGERTIPKRYRDAAVKELNDRLTTSL